MAMVMVVDDEPDLLAAIRVLLEEAGFAVATASTALAAFRVMKRHLPQVILMDVLLSGVDGREITRQIKRHPLFHHIPVIVMSAHPGIDASARQAGANDVLEKPFAMEELLQKINHYL